MIFRGCVVSVAMAPVPGHRTGMRRIAFWFPAPLSCGALSPLLSLVCWQSNHGGGSEVFLLWRGTTQLQVCTLRGLTLLPGAHSSTFGANPLHADSKRCHHGRAGRIGNLGHHQVWWLSQWRARAAESELRKSNHVGCEANVQLLVVMTTVCGFALGTSRKGTAWDVGHKE